MRMSKEEINILNKACTDKKINPQILKNIYLTEEKYFYSNYSSENAKLQEILKEIKFWAEKGE